MIQILLVCSAGMSTHLLVRRMQQAAPADITVTATAAATAGEVAKELAPDLVMLGPQIRFIIDQLRHQVAAPVVILDTQAFMQMDGPALMAQAMAALAPAPPSPPHA